MHSSRYRVFLFALALAPLVAPQGGVLVRPAFAQALVRSKKKVSGVVVDAQGQPIANADVVLAPDTPDAEQAPTVDFKTDAAGHFAGEFDSTLPPDDATGAEEGILFLKGIPVLIHAPGYALTRTYLGKEEAKIVLPRGVKVSGKVKDAAGKPVAGAHVQIPLLFLASDSGELSQLMSYLNLGHLLDSPVKQVYQTVSAADGTWTIPDLPLGSHLRVGLADPLFTSETREVKLAETAEEITPTAPDLVANPAASVSGRVLLPDGKPVANAVITGEIKGKGTGNAETRSAADGSYTLGGLVGGKVTIRVIPPSDAWAPGGIPDVPLQVSTVAQAPNITLNSGVLLTGTITDVQTKQPVPGTEVMANGPFGYTASAPSDADGHYHVRVVAGANRFYIYDHAPDYLRNEDAQPDRTVQAADTAAPDFTLRRGITLQGTALDEAGQPAAGAVISSGNFFEGTVTLVDSKGNWVLRGVDPSGSHFGGGNRTLGMITLKSDGLWEVSQGAQVSTANPTAIALTLRHVQLEDVVVHVRTPDGAPLADTPVIITLFLDLTNGARRSSSALTNARGEVTVRKLRPEMSAEIKPIKEGYTLQKAGTVAALKTLNQGPRTTDAILTPLNVSIQGTVVDATGKPVQGVLIAPLKSLDPRDTKFVTTDKDGKFTLDKLQGGAQSLGAARGRQWSRVEVAAPVVKAGAAASSTVRITLGAPDTVTPGRDLDSTYEFLDDWKSEAGIEDYEWSSMVAQFARFDAPRAFKLLHKDNGTLEPVAFQSVVEELVETDPVLAAQWAEKYLNNQGDDQQAQSIWLSIAAANVQKDPAGARAIYDRVVAQIAKNPGRSDMWRNSVLTGLAGHFDLPEAERWQAALDKDFDKLDADQQAFQVSSYLKAVAQADLPRAEKMLTRLSPSVQVRGLEEIIPVVAKYDQAAALRLMAQLEKLVNLPNLPIPEDRNDAMYRPKPLESLDRARIELVNVLVKTDLPAAYQQAQKMGTTGYARQDLRAKIMAQLPPAQAVKLLQDEFDSARDATDGDPVNEMAYVAALMHPLDAAKSEAMFQEAKAKMTSKGRFPDLDDISSPTTWYAFFRAESNPAESRLYLENEWRRLYDKLKKGREAAEKVGISPAQDGESNTLEEFLQNVVFAMMPVSTDRASEMQQQLALLKASGGFYRDSMVAWLLATQAQRNRMFFQYSGVE